MNILQFGKYYFPVRGGMERHLQDLSSGLQRQGHHVACMVFNNGVSGSNGSIEGIPVRRIGRWIPRAPPVNPLAPRCIAQQSKDVDLVHVHAPNPTAEWASARSKAPVVITHHADIMQPVRAWVAAPLQRKALQRATRVIVTHPAMLERSQALQRVAHKVRVVPLGIDTSWHASTAPPVSSRPVVLFVGRLVPYKGLDVLLRAMRCIDADLLIVGQGPLLGPLERLAFALGIQNRVTFLPECDDARLRALYQQATVATLPSVTAAEAFGLAQLEALAAGTPVVSCRLGTGVDQVNIDGKTGATVPPGDEQALATAINHFLLDEDARRLAGQAAAQRARQFPLSAMVQATIGVYEEALEAQ